MTCEPIIRESFHQAEDSEVVQEPQTEADNSVLEIDPVFRTYSMLNLAAPKAMHMQQNRSILMLCRHFAMFPHKRAYSRTSGNYCPPPTKCG